MKETLPLLPPSLSTLYLPCSLIQRRYSLPNSRGTIPPRALRRGRVGGGCEGGERLRAGSTVQHREFVSSQTMIYENFIVPGVHMKGAEKENLANMNVIVWFRRL